MRNIASFLRVSLLCGTFLLLSHARAAYFTDVLDNGSTNRCIMDAAFHQLMEGFPDGTFRPTQPLHRAERVMVMARLLNTALKGFMVLPATPLPESSDDIPAAHWAAPAAQFLGEHGLPTPIDHANAVVTKGDFLVEVYRILHAGARTTPTAAAAEFRDNALIADSWLSRLQAPITRKETARLLEDFLYYLTQHAVAEGTITRLETDAEGFRWATLDTAIGECQLCLPTRGVVITGGSEDAVRIGATIRTLSDAVGGTGGRGKYYRAREVTVINSPKSVASQEQPLKNQ